MQLAPFSFVVCASNCSTVQLPASMCICMLLVSSYLACSKHNVLVIDEISQSPSYAADVVDKRSAVVVDTDTSITCIVHIW